MKKMRILLVITLIYILWGFFPKKIAVKTYDKDKELILVEKQTATLTTWRLSDNSFQDKDVWLTGNVPDFRSYDVISANNIYVCYGNYTTNHVSAAGECPTFHVDDWEILYPVKRKGILPLPKSYLCNFDYNLL